LKNKKTHGFYYTKNQAFIKITLQMEGDDDSRFFDLAAPISGLFSRPNTIMPLLSFLLIFQFHKS